MSLRVWLPLNGDLNNQGLSDITVTNNGATINDSGKIGKCYSFGTSTSYIDIQKEAMTSFTTEASVCFWLKILTWNTSYATYFQAGATGVSWAHYTFGLLRNNANSTCCFTISNGSTASNNSYLTPALELNTWYHIGLCYKTGHCLIYINGQLYQDYSTSIVPNFSGIARISLGMGNNHSGYQSNCLMNDVRIYDHALSAKEVEEIAKGLVLHYKLDDAYSEATTNLCSQLVQGGQMTLANNILTHNGTNSDTYWYIKPKEALVGGAIYTISCYLSGFALDTDWIQWGVGAQSGDNNAGHWKTYNGYNSFTFTMPAGKDGSTANFILDDSNGGTGRSQIFTISNVQLELKDHATPFVEYGQSRPAGIIYDSSGYGNDGTVIGDLIIDSNSPRYGVSTNLTTTSSHIATTTLTTAGFTNSYSISWWGNVSTYSGRMMWGFTNGNRLNGIYNGNLWNTGDGANNPLYQPGTTTQVSAPTVNIWHHFVMVGDGTTCKVYKDGELWGQAKTYKSLTGTIIYFNGWANATNYTLENTKLSDFRIYATALTPEQIKELYNTSMSIDNNGNIHVRELVEL